MGYAKYTEDDTAIWSERTGSYEVDTRRKKDYEDALYSYSGYCGSGQKRASFFTGKTYYVTMNINKYYAGGSLR